MGAGLRVSPRFTTRTIMTEILEKVYDPQRIEAKWYEYWEEQGFFHAKADGAKPGYCIVIPPPNVTGVLHMGHALMTATLFFYERYRGRLY